MYKNNLAKYFLNNIDSFILKKQSLTEFLEVVNSNIPLYNLIKSEYIKTDIKSESLASTYNLTFDICNYSTEILRLLSKQTIIKYSDNFYKEALQNIMTSCYITTLEVKNYFLYNCIYNITRSEASSNVINEIYKEDILHCGFLYENFINYIQIHKNSSTPMLKEIFLKLLNRPALISFYIKNKYINKEIIHPDNLLILEVIAYQDKNFYKCDKMISKKTKNLCKMIDKDNLYNVLFN